MAALEVEVSVRKKNQITLPEAIVQRLGVEPGDRLIFRIDDASPTGVQVHPVRRSYYGALAGVYGTPEEVEEYIREERASWGK